VQTYQIHFLRFLRDLRLFERPEHFVSLKNLDVLGKNKNRNFISVITDVDLTDFKKMTE
jgi:hypothetical protein